MFLENKVFSHRICNQSSYVQEGKRPLECITSQITKRNQLIKQFNGPPVREMKDEGSFPNIPPQNHFGPEEEALPN